MRRTLIVTITLVVTAAATITIDNVAVRLRLPEGNGLSGVCLYRNGPDKRRHVMFKSVQGSASRKRHGDAAAGGDYVVAGDLAADRVYEGTFARLEDGDQVARFGCDNGQRFEIATPFVVPGRDLDSMLAVRESMERRFGVQQQQPQRSVTAEHMSVTLRGVQKPWPAGNRGDGGDVTVDVFQLYKKPNAAGTVVRAQSYSAYPYARYALRRPIDNLMLADLPPDQMLAVKFRRTVPAQATNDNLTDNSIFIYTGGLYPRGAANLTEMLDERGLAFATGPDSSDADTDTAATSSFQIDAKQAHLLHDSYGKKT